MITQRIIHLIKPYWVRLLAAMVCMLVVAGVTSLMAFMVKPVLDDIFFQKKISTLHLLPPLIILLYMIKGIFAYGQSYLMSFVGEKIIANLREALYAHLQKLSLSYFDRTATGLLMSRITNDVTLIQGAVSSAVTGILKIPLPSWVWSGSSFIAIGSWPSWPFWCSRLRCSLL
jgi:subfamily B ATP-binding cassette protein MsbA